MTDTGPARGLAAHATATPDKIAIVEGDQTYSYSELYDEACRLAHVLLQRGVSVAKPVALMLPNSAEMLVATQAAALAGAPYVPINWHLKSDELSYILTDSCSAVLVTHVDLLEFVRPALAEAPDCRLIVVGRDYEDLLGHTSNTPVAGWPVARWMFYTSGTTGRPKGVVHGEFDPATMIPSEEGIVALWQFEPDDVYLLAGPAYHAGPGGYAGTTLYVGGTVIVMRTWDAQDALRLIQEQSVTLSFLTPAHFIRMLEVPETVWQTHDLHTLRLIIHGGAPCPVDVKRRIIQLLAPAEVAEVYGGSEGGGTKIHAADWLQHPGSVGRPWPGTEIRILDDSGVELPAGTDGMIFLKPPGDTRFRYHRDADKTAAAWRRDAFTLGDIGHLDRDGYLYLTDRASDMVLWNGVNIYPREIEVVLQRHQAVVDCSVVGVPHRRRLSRLS